MAKEINGIAVAAVGAGAAFVYAGISGRSILTVIQTVVSGKSAATAPQANKINTDIPPDAASSSVPPSTSGGALPSGGSVQEVLHNAAKLYGWDTGSQWQALNALEIAEAGYNPRAKNDSSGALGIAQALGHGNGSATAGSLGNEYGGYGLSDAQAKAANSGDVNAQALWMVNYIHSRWGDPLTAWGGYHARGSWY